MNQPAGASLPGLFRAGDIGVSSEWRDITLDWMPLLTADGVNIYGFLRDAYDDQRSRWPFRDRNISLQPSAYSMSRWAMAQAPIQSIPSGRTWPITRLAGSIIPRST